MRDAVVYQTKLTKANLTYTDLFEIGRDIFLHFHDCML